LASIKVSDVSVHLPVIDANARMLRGLISKRRTGATIDARRIVVVQALNKLNLNIEDGERIGLIGHNGAGKTTLLRVLAGVYAPTSGTITTSGRVSAMLNPSLGMDSEDNAIENIRTIGMYLGMGPAEIDSKMQDIADFTELGEYLHLPVRTYSAGMQIRLAFAIATSIDPEILLLDEGFAAGDARFSDRAASRVNSLLRRTSILVLATHSEGLIREFCTRCVLMDQGNVVFDGDIDTAFAHYRARNEDLARQG
jgi:ABC-type polysaccharide/polyol phosphate transport system ATPase subunit